MASANEDLVDSFVRHAVDLERLSAGERRKALRILKKLEDDLVGLIAQGAGTTWSKARMRALLLQVRETIGSAYDTMRAKIQKDLQDIAKLELTFTTDAANKAIGADLLTVEFDSGLLRSVVGDAVIAGGPMSDWWERQAAKTEQMFADTTRMGILSGDSTDDIVRTLRNDVMSGTIKRNVEALVTTSIASVAADAKQEFYEQNEDVIDAVMQRSTLDSRTTLICQAYSAKRWSLPDYEPIDHNLPFINDGGSPAGCPRHWRCRSVIVPVIGAFDTLGARMGKKDTARAERAFHKKLKEQDFTDREIAKAQMNAQASMSGYVPEDLDYQAWLETQPENVQIEALGPRRWKMWKDGKITTFSQLIDQNGNSLTLDELKRKLGGEEAA
jgi:hypothetical protein